MAHIAIDIDDTLYSFTTLARGVMADLAIRSGDKQLERASYAPWDEWRTPVDLLGLDKWLEIIELCHDPELIRAQTPFEYAASVCKELENDGHTLMFISHRSDHGPVFDATFDWLNMWGFLDGNDEHAVLVCTDQDKGPFMRHCQYLIDDRPKTIFQFLADFDWKNKWGSHNEEKERKAFALMTPYNRGMTDVPNLYLAPQSWQVIRHYLVREGVLSGNADRSSLAF